MNFLPLCTAMVWPIISGTMVERRDHVFTTFFSFRALSASTLFRRGASTNGPFFSERPIGFLPCYLVPFQLFAPISLLGHPTANRKLFGPNLSPDQVGTALVETQALLKSFAVYPDCFWYGRTSVPAQLAAVLRTALLF